MLYYLITVLHLFNSGIAWFLFIYLLWKLLGRKAQVLPTLKLLSQRSHRKASLRWGQKVVQWLFCHTGLVWGAWGKGAVPPPLFLLNFYNCASGASGWEKAASSCPHHLVSCKKGSSQANIFSVSASPMFIQLINLIISFRKLPQNKTKRWEVHPGSRYLLDPTQQLQGWWIPGAGTTNKKFVLVIK